MLKVERRLHVFQEQQQQPKTTRGNVLLQRKNVIWASLIHLINCYEVRPSYSRVEVLDIDRCSEQNQLKHHRTKLLCTGDTKWTIEEPNLQEDNEQQSE